MKKKLPIFLFIVCLCVAVIGMIGRSGIDTPVQSGGELGSAEDAGLLDVATPDYMRSQIKGYTGFALSFNADNHTPNWVAWELLGSETDGPQSRGNLFWKDDEIIGCPDVSDYKKSGFDRGHMCPAADQKWSEKAMTDCFSFANMAPQDHALNAGAWQTLEKKERHWARRDSAILIVAGPVYEDADSCRIGGIGVRVPSAFFKVIVAPYIDWPRGIAFVYPNMASPGNMENYVVTIDDVERITGLDFFHNLPDDIEEKVESVSSFRDWNKNK